MDKKFNPKMLTLARESRGLSQTELATNTKIQQTILSKLEHGLRQMDDFTIGIIANELDYPVDFFYQNAVLYPPNGHYRKKAQISAKVITQAEALMNVYRINLQNLLMSVDLPEKNFPVVTIGEIDASKVARQLRAFWKVPKGPITNITELLEDNGIVVIHCDFRTDKIDGRTMMTEGGHPIIFVNKTMPADRQRLTIAHELGHVAMHIENPNVFDRDIEDEAYEFATEFLMPKSEFIPQIPAKITLAVLGDLKRYWRVSMRAILRWAKTLKAITENQAEYLWRQFSALGMTKDEPIPVPRETPSLLQELIQAHYNELEYSFEQMAAILCLNDKDFEERFLDKPKAKLKLIRNTK